jgi:GNAT superfamily N-acetyltransferase
VDVKRVETSRDLKRFIDFPYRLHRRDSIWVPPLKHDVRGLLSRDKNPFFAHAEADYFLAERNGTVVGRIAAISNKLHNETHDDRVGFFGFFECQDDQAVADALFEAAGEWLSARGHDVMRGPASFSVNDECGLLVEGFDTPPTLMSPHNPPYYATLIEGAGFTKAKNMLMYCKGVPDGLTDTPLPDRLSRALTIITNRQKLTLRPLNMDDFDNEIELVKRLYNQAWEKNWGFIPMTDAEIDHLAAQFKPVIVPDLVPFVERDGEVIGFGLALPDFNVVFRSNRSGRMFPTALKLLWRLKTQRIHRLRILLLGIVPEYRGKGIDAVLYHWIWTKGHEHKMRWGEAGWILEDNAAMRQAADKVGFEPYKTYSMYDRAL